MELDTDLEIFYSRRIGQEISFNENDYILNNEELINYDKKPNLINSVKLTGTTDKKLSIGFLNAITAKAHAYFKNKIQVMKESSYSSNY